MPPNSFAEWMVGANVLSRRKAKKSPRRLVKLDWSTDADSEEDTLSVTVPRPHRSKGKASSKKVRFSQPTKSALKKSKQGSSEEATDSEVSTSAKDTTSGDEETSEDETSESESTSEAGLSSEADSDCPCGKCKKVRAILKARQKKIESDAEIHAKHKEKKSKEKANGNGKKKEQKKAEPASETTTEATTETTTEATQTETSESQAQSSAKEEDTSKSKNKKKKKHGKKEETDVSDTTEATTDAATDTSQSEKKPEKESPKEKKKSSKKTEESEESSKAAKKDNGRKESKKAEKSKAEKVKILVMETTEDSALSSPPPKVKEKKPKLPPHHPPPEIRHPNLLMPIHAQVLQVEHTVEAMDDPRPNAFYDTEHGIMRVYHGPSYGNPYGGLYPKRVYKNQVLPLGTPHPSQNPYYMGFPQGKDGNRSPQMMPQPQMTPPQMMPQSSKDWFQGNGTIVVGEDVGGAADNAKTTPFEYTPTGNPPAPPKRDHRNNGVSNGTRHSSSNIFSQSMTNQSPTRKQMRSDNNNLWTAQSGEFGLSSDWLRDKGSKRSAAKDARNDLDALLDQSFSNMGSNKSPSKKGSGNDGWAGGGNTSFGNNNVGDGNFGSKWGSPDGNKSKTGSNFGGGNVGWGGSTGAKDNGRKVSWNNDNTGGWSGGNDANDNNNNNNNINDTWGDGNADEGNNGNFDSGNNDQWGDNNNGTWGPGNSGDNDNNGGDNNDGWANGGGDNNDNNNGDDTWAKTGNNDAWDAGGGDNNNGDAWANGGGNDNADDTWANTGANNNTWGNDETNNSPGKQSAAGSNQSNRTVINTNTTTNNNNNNNNGNRNRSMPGTYPSGGGNVGGNDDGWGSTANVDWGGGNATSQTSGSLPKSAGNVFGKDDWGDADKKGGGGNASWADPSAAQSTGGYWANEGKGMEEHRDF